VDFNGIADGKFSQAGLKLFALNFFDDIHELG
jgi:hypothetical protein